MRIQSSILSPDLPPDTGHRVAHQDADVIVTAAVLGFVAGRAWVGHPIRFDWHDDTERADTEQAADVVNRALRAAGLPDVVAVGQTQEWTSAALITGAAGAAAAPFASRHATPTSEAAEELRQLAASLTDPIGYQGKGAYTGFVDDPVTRRGSITSTAQYNVPTTGFGDRWRPETYSYARSGRSQADAPWGLLNDGQPIADMVTQPETPGGVVGYAHGMVQAVYSAVAAGPWCTPFEIAVGRETTKLASCLPCTLFMYAAGFPPSSIHLGRGDSWLPFYPVTPTGAGYSLQVDEAVRSANTRWCLEMWQHLDLGRRYLASAELSDAHRDRLSALDTYLAGRRMDDLYAAANLLLDALTLHARISTRILATLQRT